MVHELDVASVGHRVVGHHLAAVPLLVAEHGQQAADGDGAEQGDDGRLTAIVVGLCHGRLQGLQAGKSGILHLGEEDVAGVGNAGHGDIVEDHGLGGQAQRIAPVSIRDQDRGGAVVKAARGAGFGHQCAGFKVETALKSGRWSAGWSAAIAVAADVVAGRGISLVFNLKIITHYK